MSGVRLALLGVLLAQPVRADLPPQLLLQAEAQILSPVCAGQDLVLEGNHNVVTPFGFCRSLLIKGIDNRVTLAVTPNATLRVEGGGNQVIYRGPIAARVDVLGADNAVVAQAAAAPAPDTGAVLRLTGDDRALALDCTGRRVSVDGSRALYLLRGGCASLSIRGDRVIVQAELQPGAPITVTGRGDRVGWALKGPGRPPAASVHGEANHVGRLAAIGGVAIQGFILKPRTRAVTCLTNCIVPN